jgi:hypothetical protein
MKLDSKDIIVETDNDSYTETKFGVGDLKVVFNILRSKLYSNPIQSICREYASNARDAHIEAGIADKPIEIFLPSSIDNTFKVKDFGNGISPDRINNVFVLYGNSTKRGSNEQTGGFGIGAKVGFAYTEQFQITTVTNDNGKNIKRVYIAYIDESEIGALRKMTECETDDHTGTEISISVNSNDFSLFKEGVLKSCTFWDVRPTLYGASFGNEAFYSDDKYLLLRNHNMALVLIDGIAYVMSCNYKYNLSSVAFKFKTGELSLSANREELHYDDKTRNLIEKRIQQYLTDISVICDSELNKCQSYLEALKKKNDFQRFFSYTKIFKYKDKILTDYIQNYHCCFKSSKKKVNIHTYFNLILVDDNLLPSYLKTINEFCIKENKIYYHISTDKVYDDKTVKKFEDHIKSEYNIELSDLNIVKLTDFYHQYKPKRIYKKSPKIKNFGYLVNNTYDKIYRKKTKIDLDTVNEALYLISDDCKYFQNNFEKIYVDSNQTGNFFFKLKHELINQKSLKDLPIIILENENKIKPGYISLGQKFEEYMVPQLKARNNLKAIELYNYFINKLNSKAIYNKSIEDLIGYNFSPIVSNFRLKSHEENQQDSNLSFQLEKQIADYYPMIYIIKNRTYYHLYDYDLQKSMKDYVELMDSIHLKNQKAAE